MTVAYDDLRAADVPVRRACALIGRAWATHYRHWKPPVQGHRHFGIGWHTPASVHFGTADAIDEARQTTLTAAYHANPARFGRRPTPPKRKIITYINEPTPTPTPTPEPEPEPEPEPQIS